jgi:hypothetical protein
MKADISDYLKAPGEERVAASGEYDNKLERKPPIGAG